MKITMYICTRNSNNKMFKYKGLKCGDIIRIDKINGPQQDKQFEGKEGRINMIDDFGNCWGNWGKCAILPGVDKIEIIGHDPNWKYE